ncbi:MAG: hypothetical protein PHS88_08795 [Candidatus Omnitrophica bacterium]|nr:hypothetical protein [Candidatus Omnitrophota bacterium]
MKKIKKNGKVLIVALWVFTTALIPFASAGSSEAMIVEGLGRTFGSVFELPKALLGSVMGGGFPFSLVTGVLSGTYRTVVGTLGGALETAQGAAPYAKYAVFLV